MAMHTAIREIEKTVFILRPPNASKTAEFHLEKRRRSSALIRGA
jgi:hypothetical protein